MIPGKERIQTYFLKTLSIFCRIVPLILNIYLVFSKMSVAVEKIPDASVLVNFASLRSAYDATVDALQYPQVP